MQELSKHSSGTLGVALVMEAPGDDRRGQKRCLLVAFILP